MKTGTVITYKPYGQDRAAVTELHYRAELVTHIEHHSCLEDTQAARRRLESTARLLGFTHLRDGKGGPVKRLGPIRVPAGYTEEELERDNPFNQWMQDFRV